MRLFSTSGLGMRLFSTCGLGMRLFSTSGLGMRLFSTCGLGMRLFNTSGLGMRLFVKQLCVLVDTFHIASFPGSPLALMKIKNFRRDEGRAWERGYISRTCSLSLSNERQVFQNVQKSSTWTDTKYKKGFSLLLPSLVPRPCPAFRRLQYCKRQKAGRGLGTRLPPPLCLPW